MLELLKLAGTITGSYDSQPFTLEFKDQKLKVTFQDISTLKTVKDLVYDSWRNHQNNPTFQALMKEIDVEIYLQAELIARLGKNAKSNFISSMLGVQSFEVVSNSQMSNLMKLM